MIFYIKVITELVDWSVDAEAVPSWATSDVACGLWQFASHVYPIFYAAILIAIVYHALVTLFMDYSGGYEERIKRYLPLILMAICTIVVFVAAPSGFFGKAQKETGEIGSAFSPILRPSSSHSHAVTFSR